MRFDVNQIISYREMCNDEDQQQLQHGMNFDLHDGYSVVLMSDFTDLNIDANLFFID